jgi:hypothetical protein
LTDEEQNTMGLTEAEMEALEADEDEAEGDEGADEGNDAQAKGEANDSAATATGEDESGDDTGETAENPAPPLRAVVPKDAKERLETLEADEAKLEDQFNDGDITAKEYRTGLRKIEDERKDVEWAVKKAELATEMQREAIDNLWEKDVGDFMRTTAAPIAKSETLLTAFDVHVKRVTGDPENGKLSNRAMLAKAYKDFQAELAPLTGKSDAPDPKGGKASDPQPEKRRPGVPPTLARVPAAELEDTGDGGRFAALDRLADENPVAYEKALAAMSPAEQAAYLGG